LRAPVSQTCCKRAPEVNTGLSPCPENRLLPPGALPWDGIAGRSISQEHALPPACNAGIRDDDCDKPLLSVHFDPVSDTFHSVFRYGANRSFRTGYRSAKPSFCWETLAPFSNRKFASSILRGGVSDDGSEMFRGRGAVLNLLGPHLNLGGALHCGTL
jgi:hypothetical protein